MKEFKQIIISDGFEAFTIAQDFKDRGQNILVLTSDEDAAVKLYNQIAFFVEEDISAQDAGHQRYVYFLPSLDTIPYDRISPSINLMSQRAHCLSSLVAAPAPKILISAACNLLVKLPPTEHFKRHSLRLRVGDECSSAKLIQFLVELGFIRSVTAMDNGEFASRGEIIDIVSVGKGYRINLSWDRIESIKLFDTANQISIDKIEYVQLSMASEVVLDNQSIANFQDNFLKFFGVNHINAPLYQSIIDGKKFQGYENLLPLFYNNSATSDDLKKEEHSVMSSLLDFMPMATIYFADSAFLAIEEYQKNYDDFYQSRILSNKSGVNNFYYAIAPENFIYSTADIMELASQNTLLSITTASIIDTNAVSLEFDSLSASALVDTKILHEKWFQKIEQYSTSIAVIFCSSKHSIQTLKAISEEKKYAILEISSLAQARLGVINLVLLHFDRSILIDKYLFISEPKNLNQKHVPSSSKKKLKNILLELDNISEGSLVVHQNHGIGRFEQIETVELHDSWHDCLKIIYADNDILYLPVENINLIKKYGEIEVALDKLGGVNWQKRKAKIKNRIQDIAKKLMEISAKRLLCRVTPNNFDVEAYDNFCNMFPYNETEDQINAINDIQNDLTSGRLMDRLICGDVGFGKTEVAMRAAFCVISDSLAENPQVAIITPTTILCKQHYKNFKHRFQDKDHKPLANIVQLSRLVNQKASKQNHLDIESGKANIIIATHALFSKNVKFRNLKLLIIDEEQHFGVVQKEKLKELKANTHILALSATPIPRTLQMSLVGIKDLSLIATPPIDRIPVKTTITAFDMVLIRDALIKERSRGGCSFYVCPRISDIGFIEKQLKELVPELKVKIAHGKLGVAAIDETMNDFFDGKFDVLLSTSIIESGIDIQVANTMIIHRADMFGLSQLYQLRGRVGRGKVRGYVYMSLMPDKIRNKDVLRRLEILQNIDTLGAGFAIASHDMDLRGSGNLIGEEQSGHIREVGTELYQDMLDEAMEELKQTNSIDVETNSNLFVPTINLKVPVFIPSTYIEDSALKLSMYRRVAALASEEELKAFISEMNDRFGDIPETFLNLLEIVRIKHRCYVLGIEAIDTGPNGFVITFNEKTHNADMIIAFINKHPRHSKVRPGGKLVYIKNLANKNIIQEVYALLLLFNNC